MILRTTPVEKVDLPPGGNVWVKREDLCTQPPAPPFSKMRGVLAHLKECKGRGAKYIGYTETSISMAGWGVAYACKELGGLRAIIYDPQYKNPLPILQLHRKMWEELGAETRPIKAGMAKVNWHISNKMLVEEFGTERALLLPLGLPLPETVALTAEETERTLRDFPETRSIVVNIGSGTIGAGVWKGAEKWTENNAPPQKVTIYGVMGRTGHIGQKTAKIAQKAGLQHEGIFQTRTKFILEDPGWEYTERSNALCPFPCHPYYDLKAWEWLVSNYEKLEKPVIFWNIGH